MNGFLKGILFVALALYVVSPVDMVPGPIDDILLVMMTFISQRGHALEG